MMNDFITPTLAFSTLLLHIVFLISLFIFFIKKKNKFLDFIFQHGILLAFCLAFVSSGISLYYSDYLGLEPCVLCWYQRIPMYSLVIILYMAIARKNDKSVIPFGLSLSVTGIVLAIYHVYILYFSQEPTNCSLFSDVPCTTLYFNYFGYISIPTLSLTSFLIITLLLIGKNKYAQ